MLLLINYIHPAQQVKDIAPGLFIAAQHSIPEKGGFGQAVFKAANQLN
jgi:hypothetical protein